MNITPTSTWAIRSLVEILKINAEDVSVISAGAKKLTPAITLRVPVPSPKTAAKAVQPPQIVNIYFSPSKLYGSSKARFLAKNQL